MEFLDKVGDFLIGQGWSGLVAAGLAWLLYIVLKRLDKSEAARAAENAEWDRRFSALQEKRFEEAKASVLALEQNTRALIANHAASESRASSIADTATALQSLIAAREADKDYFGKAVERIEGELRRISGSRQ